MPEKEKSKKEGELAKMLEKWSLNMKEIDDRGGEKNKRTKGGGEADEGRDRRSYRKVGLGEEMEEMEE